MPDDLDFGSTVRGFTPGQKVFERYVLTRILGRGGMGMVWLARDEKLERDVALKFLPELVALDARALDDLKRETRRSLDLTHPNIVRIYDLVGDSQSAAIAMEWVDGQTLSALALEKTDRVFSVEEIRPWVKKLCEALDYAHEEAKVVHRDLKPANLMVTREGRIKITDFGISATLSDSTTRVSRDAGTSGSPPYMSPQQMLGKPPAATDDVYSLGATLYELLTGKPPFHSGRIDLQVMQEMPPSVASRRDELGVKGEDVPELWETTILSCLAKEPGDRPPSLQRVWQRLEGAHITQRPAPSESSSIPDSTKVAPEKRLPASAHSSTEPPLYPKPKVRRPPSASRIFFSAAIMCVFVLAGLWWFIVGEPEYRQKKDKEKETAAADLRHKQELERAREERAAELETARMAASQHRTQDIKIPDLGMELRYIPAGTFVMGIAEHESSYDYLGSAKPQHNVTISQAFWLSATEVTIGQWKTLMEEAPSQSQDDVRTNAPQAVSWGEAMAFCQKLTDRERAANRLPTGYHYTLPTEAQWEYAARASVDEPKGMVIRREELERVAWYIETSGGTVTRNVGTKTANPWGLYDMQGNVGEWCLDWAGSYSPEGVTDPKGPPTGEGRIVRGGSFLSREAAVRVVRRAQSDPLKNAGFRIALSLIR